ncbi:hypothetical protein FACS1894133_2340 [Clostridia bacterium]|nr:hypothetical protein FACS1894133_2340 [Clostridia bacterium]
MYEEEQLHNLQSAARTAKEAVNFISGLANNATAPNAQTAVAQAGVQPFAFTGQITDLSYFGENASMTKGVLDSISDPELKNAVLGSLMKAEQQGLIEVDLKGGKVDITETGKAYIKTPEFLKYAQLDKAAALNNAATLNAGALKAAGTLGTAGLGAVGVAVSTAKQVVQALQTPGGR